MTDYHIGSYRSIDAFVRDKLDAFRAAGFSFDALFELMFRETENVLYERSDGFKIRKTTYDAIAGLTPDSPMYHMKAFMEREQEKSRAIASSATAFEEEFGVLRQVMPMLSA